MEISKPTKSAGLVSGLPDEKIEHFKTRLRGQLLRPNDEGYDKARSIWNGMIDRRPGLIARCTGVADVVEAVNFARDNNLLVSVRSGGHNVSGNAVCEGGLMIDLSLLKGIRVDPGSRTVRVQAGVNWGDVDRETQLFGLAAPSGIVSTTGVAGLTLGGGFGWLSRAHGFTSDNLISVDVITADGRFVRADADENVDLFWGIRGGGGNFGIVTSFEFKLYPVGPVVMAGMIVYRMEEAPEVLRFMRDFAANAPNELTCLGVLRLAPPLPALPEYIHGKPMVGVVVCYTGSVEEGERIVRPLKEFGNPVADLISAKPFVMHQSMFDIGNPPGRNYYWKSEYLPGLSDEMLDTAIDHASRITSPMTAVLLFQVGGAIKNVRESDSAASQRDAEFIMNIATSWVEPGSDDRHIKWARDMWSAMRPYSTGGVYVNFLSADDGEDRVHAAYGKEKYERLVELKNKYDPTNLFRMNQNIKPTIQS